VILYPGCNATVDSGVVLLAKPELLFVMACSLMSLSPKHSTVQSCFSQNVNGSLCMH
jgi:hypothetical protein